MRLRFRTRFLFGSVRRRRFAASVPDPKRGPGARDEGGDDEFDRVRYARIKTEIAFERGCNEHHYDAGSKKHNRVLSRLGEGFAAASATGVDERPGKYEPGAGRDEQSLQLGNAVR